MTVDGSNTAGNPEHAEHVLWLTELGRVTRAAAQLATICFDLARIVGGVHESEIYDDPLGALEKRLRAIVLANLPEIDDFMALLDTARRTRNDVMHAFLVRDGLLRRTRKGGYDRDFYSVESLREARQHLEDASRIGANVLHANGGAVLESWRQRPQ